MKYKKIILVVIVLVSCLFVLDRQDQLKHQRQIDSLCLQNIDYLMIVAHPDDETIWGGNHLLKGSYLVVCLTNGNNSTRKKEFLDVMEKTGNQGLILDYPDKIKGKRDNWNEAKSDIGCDIQYLLQKKKWKTVITHNPEGEYGHIHHRMTSSIVTKKMDHDLDRLVYFGKYYKKKNIPANLQKINDTDLEEKMALIQLYGSQSQVMEHLNHMMSHENWVHAKDWR